MNATLILRNGHRLEGADERAFTLRLYSRRMIAGYIVRPEPPSFQCNDALILDYERSQMAESVGSVIQERPLP